MTDLTSPLKIREIRLRNRIVMPPMQTGKASFEGEVTNKLINFYARRSSHVGLPIVEHAFVSLNGRIGPKQLGIYSDSLLEGFEKLAKALHEVGAPAIVQISHAGGVTNRKVIGTQPVSPSNRTKAHRLQEKEIFELAEDFALAAQRAVNAGFDGVELHGAHGYLLNQFFSPLFNDRADGFGGSLENRMRFPLLVAKRVRQVLDDKLLLYRLGSDDLAAKGTHIEDSVSFARELESLGVDIIDVSGGMCGSEPKQLRKATGYFVPQAIEIKKAVKAPVIGVGGISKVEYANDLILGKYVDLVAVGRTLWHDPEWAQKAIESIKSFQLNQKNGKVAQVGSKP